MKTRSARAVHWARVSTAQGPVAVGYDEAGRVLRSAPGERSSDLLEALQRDWAIAPVPNEEPPPPVVATVRQALAEGPDTLLAESGLTAFQQRVLQATAKIAPGERLTYGELARRIGSPGAARAVGTALARNPFPALIPCHRVVRADGSIGNYSCGGSRVKQRLLKEETSTLPRDRV